MLTFIQFNIYSNQKIKLKSLAIDLVFVLSTVFDVTFVFLL